MNFKLGEVVKINPITAQIGDVKFQQDELLEIISVTNSEVTVKRLFSGEIVTVSKTALKFVI